jgi:hypothetical protein
MLRSVLLSILIAVPCFSQTNKQIVQTTGPCSPAVTGDNNKFEIWCEGITKEQGQQFLEILNKIAKNQLDPKVVIAKLDGIEKSVAQIKENTQIDPHKYDDIADTLTKFMDEGEAILSTWLKKDDDSLLKTQWADWNSRVQQYLANSLGKAVAGQFRNSHGSAWMGSPEGHSIVGGGYWQDIKGKQIFLRDLISELLRKTR